MTNEYNPDGKEIRFIDSHYKDLFHIPDGSPMAAVCRFTTQMKRL